MTTLLRPVWYEEPRCPFSNLPKQMYPATNGHPASMADVILIFYGRHTDLVGQYKENVCQMFADSIS